ncbi:hypothetical protein GCM10009716_46440 [Streptomyces sodiiphilus]|uniref:Uncharacterized protein n=1 Tax=Streptomyces sodiiphilus TaxID=226217 RepID=A0ABN2PVE3_9ACTN
MPGRGKGKVCVYGEDHLPELAGDLAGRTAPAAAGAAGRCPGGCGTSCRRAAAALAPAPRDPDHRDPTGRRPGESPVPDNRKPL